MTPNSVRARRANLALGVLLALSVFVVGLLWAKWAPYLSKALTAQRTHRWSGSSILTAGGVRAGDAPSWRAATTFFHAYFLSIWPALVVALLISASVQALVPRSWLPRLLNRRGLITSGLAGGAASLPSMMCTCCAAPVAVTLRRGGVTRAAAMAYWLGNPLLNPAVLVFLLFVAPWQWALTRAVIGIATVIGVAMAVGLVTGGAAPRSDAIAPSSDESRGAPQRFVRALTCLCLILLPEYAILVLAVGTFRGWLLRLAAPSHQGLLIAVLAAIVGTLIVIPTAAEIPILQSLALLGVSSGTLGALLITLPAISVPGAAMVARSFGWKAIATATTVVIAAGVLGAAVLSALP
ncbi:permease [Mycobacterium sherrisii]|uniref:Permease n=1 Tax=Mycobacterium sherrisii TaxID=243061 RepID=A0A1E3SFP3_9MYCO|nr:permease [Mycobacterium sherrisii]MCV7032620.1 permease [Mycobacterium sherrisii]MEC4765455.1 permease [Mycobacterium sherrisii]ODR00408.1 permease [Mycobacterium sherrisii]ORW78052.1 permease [Mycobacterium sherrisii]